MGLNIFKKKESIAKPVSLNKDSVGLDVALTLTETGKKKVTEMGMKEPFFSILCTLDSAGGTMSLRELVQETKMNQYSVRQLVRSLAGSGYIRGIKA